MSEDTPSVNNTAGLTQAEQTELVNLLGNNQVKRVFLGKLTGANMNVLTDQPITINSSSYIIRGILVTNASINMTTAKGSLYTATSKGGTPLTTSPTTTPYTALSSAAAYVDLTLAALTVLTVATIYLSLTTAQGVAATADFYIYGDRLD